MYYEIGQKIKELRQFYDITQKELAEDICTQATICKIERGEIQPTSLILHQLAIRLGVDANYFFFRI